MCHEDILLKNQRIIVPTTFRSEIKSINYHGHFGLENSKKCAHQALFWPLINSEIEDMIKNCPTCLLFCNRQPSELAIKHPVPQESCSLNPLAADLFRLYGYYYLLVVDYNFKFVALKILKICNPLPLLTSITKNFRNMVFLRN